MHILVQPCLRPAPFCSVDIKKPAAFSEPNQASATQQKKPLHQQSADGSGFLNFPTILQGNPFIPPVNSTN
jgi:hypothetical protein